MATSATNITGINDIRYVLNADGTKTLAVASESGGGIAQQIEGLNAAGDPASANPVLIGYKADDDSLAPFADPSGVGLPNIAVTPMQENTLPHNNRPFVAGYRDNGGDVATVNDDLNLGAPNVAVGNNVKVEGTEPQYSPSAANPVLMGFLDTNGNVYPWAATNVDYVPSVFIFNNSIVAQTKPAAFNVFQDQSGTISAANVAQEIAAANFTRQFFIFQNISDTDMWLSVVGTASATFGSIKVAAGATFSFPGTGIPYNAVSLFCTVIAKAFTCWEG